MNNKLSLMLPYLESGFDYVSDFTMNVDSHGQIIGKGSTGNTSTIAIRKKAVIKLLPVENELSFSTLFKLGRGIRIEEPCTYYRLHGNNMTNRKEPGKWQNYLASITYNLAKHLFLLSKVGVPEWKVSKREIRKVSYEFTAQSNYNKVERSLELKHFISSYKYLIFMLYYSAKSNKLFTLFNMKIIIKFSYHFMINISCFFNISIIFANDSFCTILTFSSPRYIFLNFFFFACCMFMRMRI